MHNINNDHAKLRQKTLANTKRILVKVGSGVLAGPIGLDLERIQHLAGQIANLRAQGREIVVVSSGAILAGMGRRGLQRRPESIPEKQAAAAVGQSLLMRAWDDALGQHGRTAGQILLTADDLAHRHRYLNARHTIRTLLDWGCTPIINENDTVMVDEIKFGDNDQLAALIAAMMCADLAVFLSDVDGLFDGDPKETPDAKPIRTVQKVDTALLGLAGDRTSQAGTGGMRSKLLAAKKTGDAGIPLLMIPGREDLCLERALGGEVIGTLFIGRESHMTARKHWLINVPRPAGTLVLDSGAAKVIRERGTSLLAVGIKNVRGAFDVGEPVRCVDENDDIIGVGLVNYTSAEINMIKGCRTDEIAARLGSRPFDEVIHRDHFALAEDMEDVAGETPDGDDDEQS